MILIYFPKMIKGIFVSDSHEIFVTILKFIKTLLCLAFSSQVIQCRNF